MSLGIAWGRLQGCLGDLGRLVLHIDARPLWESLGALGRLGEYFGGAMLGRVLWGCRGNASGRLGEFTKKNIGKCSGNALVRLGLGPERPGPERPREAERG